MASPAHRKPNPTGNLSPAARKAVMGIALVAIVVVIAGAAVFALKGSSSSATSTANGGGGGSGTGGSSASDRTTTTVAPLTVASITPAASAVDVTAQAPITVTFSAPVSGSSLPTITPAVAGTWSVTGATMTFRPTGGYLPDVTYQVTVPTTVGTVAAKKHPAVTLASVFTASFKSAKGSALRVEQMLAELGYMPLQFVASATPPSTTTTAPTASATGPAASSATTAPATTAPAAPTAASTLAAESSDPTAVATVPLAGTLGWKVANTPPTLTALWTPGTANTIDMGAIMRFENANGMTMDGLAGPKVWGALVKAVAARTVTTQPYNYLVASKASPETLTVYSNGAQVYSSLANTGVAGAPTASGTWPVFERLAVTTMSGTNPDGSKYNDPGIPWVAYFHGGDAVHGFLRGSYGVPQSVGCVELPEANAKVVYNYDTYGTLVTVTG